MNKKELTKEELFDEISQLANYCDKKLVESIYYGLIKVVSRHLKMGEEVKMPDWGFFYLHSQVPRQVMAGVHGQMKNLGARKCLKFRPNQRVKAYFRDLE